MVKIILTVLCVGAAVAFAFGCGSSESVTASAPLTRAQFVKQGNATCAGIAKKEKSALSAWEKNHEQTASSNPVKLVNEALEQIILPSLNDVADRLEGMTPPATDEAQVSHMTQTLSNAIATLESKGWEAVSEAHFSRYQREALAYGMNSCVGLLYE